jgi:hypothetical protein
MSGNEAVMIEPTNSSDTKELSMTQGEALAIAWTGIEALAKMGKAKLFRSPTTGRVWVEFSQTDYDTANGLTEHMEKK